MMSGVRKMGDMGWVCGKDVIMFIMWLLCYVW